MEKVLARCIIEMMSTNKDYLLSTINKYIARLKKQDDIKVHKDTVAEPVEKDGLFVTHAEIEAWFPSPDHLLVFCFDAMPSSVEVLQPELLTFKQKELDNFINDLQARLHSVDMAMKKMKAENAIINKNATHVFNNFIISCIRQGKNKKEDIAATMGVNVENIQPFLDELVEENKIKKENDAYKL